jgi:hypothetical protein
VYQPDTKYEPSVFQYVRIPKNPILSLVFSLDDKQQLPELLIQLIPIDLLLPVCRSDQSRRWVWVCLKPIFIVPLDVKVPAPCRFIRIYHVTEKFTLLNTEQRDILLLDNDEPMTYMKVMMVPNSKK